MAVTIVKFNAPVPSKIPDLYKIDGPDVKCSFESYWCKGRSALAGGFDEHHEWPKSLGGSEDPNDVQHLLVLCPTHHRRQHALIRAMVESGTTLIKPVRYYSNIEMSAASYAVGQWVAAGKPRIGGWPCPAAALRAA